MPRLYGHYLRILHWCNDQAITAALAEMDLTAAQGPILGYLSRQSLDPCPRDIEKEFRLSHPTVSGLLARLEKKGFVSLLDDPADGRRKRVHLLPKGRQCSEAIRNVILENEEKMLRGFTPEEAAAFSAYLSRAAENMACCKPCKGGSSKQ